MDDPTILDTPDDPGEDGATDAVPDDSGVSSEAETEAKPKTEGEDE